MEAALFREKQYFRGRYTLPFYVLLTGLTLLFGYAIVQQIVLGKPFGEKPAPDLLLVIGALIPLSLLFLFRFCFLETRVTAEGIYYRWSPFYRHFRFIRWDGLKKVAMIDYGFVGYGWRLTGHGTVYTLGGRTGLQLTRNSGSRLVLGTRKPEELADVLNHLKAEGHLPAE